ncbi:MAG: hypothetical protein IPP91_00375 [Betaproteobacteria bacterium]|nr:hypothetical protein [Betaproteobacteria bacterium]
MLTGTGAAYAQSTPSAFAGPWRGVITNVEQISCNGSTTTYAFTLPWSGTVSESGEFEGIWGLAIATRNGAPYSMAQPSGTPAWFVQSDGSAASVYGDHEANGAVNCDLTAQYSASPSLAMSGDQRCPPQPFVNSPTGETCTNTIHLSVQGTGAPPVFPMVVTGSIGPTVSNITAAIQYRPEDVGRQGSVYSFAMAPSDLVKAAPANASLPPLGYARKSDGTKDTAIACVLAQLDSSGQLQAVSPSSLQAYVTGVLSSQGQAVSVINGVATANIGGATFYVGYGTNAAAMLSGGLNRNVVTVPGARECKPQAPQTGWWWNTTEGGRGYSVEVAGNHIFFAAFLYDDTGRSNWYVATGNTSLDGSLFTGDLLKVTGGQTLTGAYKPPNPVQSAGPFTLAFSDASNGTMVWPGGTVAIERFNIIPGGLAAAPQANVPESGWWWNPAESGRGFFIEWQNGSADLAGYMYDEAGNPVWYLSLFPTPNPRTFSGNWWSYANGQTLMGGYKPPTLPPSTVAPVTVQFDTTTTATMTLPDGRQLSLTRHRF